MQIGKAGPAITSICEAHADRIEVRGRDLTRDLMGRVGFTDYFHLLAYRPRADRKPALLPRPSAGCHRRARPGAYRPGGAHDACSRSRVACRAPLPPASWAPGRLSWAHRNCAAGCWSKLRAKVRGRSRQRSRGTGREIRASGARLPGFGHPSTSRSTRAPSASLLWPSERGVAGQHVAVGARMSAPSPPRSGASRWS